MKNYAIYPYQNDLIYNDNISYNKIKVIKKEKNKSIYKTILFENINNDLISAIKKEILYFLLKKKITFSILILIMLIFWVVKRFLR